MNTHDNPLTLRVSRRNFIKIAATVGGGVIFKIALAGDTEAASGTAAKSFVPEVFLRIDPDNTVTFGLLKQEMGQGVETGLPMILADELGADWETLKVVPIDFDSSLPGYNERSGQMETGGSTSIMMSWPILRRAGASAREVLILAAAQRWSVESDECHAAMSKVHHAASGRSATFGSLAAAAAAIDPPQEPRLKNTKDFTLIGRSIHARKNPRVVRGREPYGLDVRVPGMVYAAITRSPVAGGRVVEIDDAAARAMPGVIDVVKVDGRQGDAPHWRFEEGVAVVANSTWAAFQAKRALKIVWDEGRYRNTSEETMRESLIAASRGELSDGVRFGDVDAALAGAAKVVEATYEVPFMAHALMEPLSAVADVRGGRCEIWAGSQSPQYTAHYLSQLLEIPIAGITFHCKSSGGAFGRRYFADYVAEAAIVSQRVGRPVMSVWSREDEVRQGRYHPMRRDQYRAAIDASGEWTGTDYVGVSTFFRPASSLSTYPIPNVRERSSRVEPNVNIGPWRSVADHPMAFGKESLVDEVAAAVKSDPFDFRVRLLSGTQEPAAGGSNHDWLLQRNAQLRPRFLRVLAALRERSKWDEHVAAGRHCGVAISDFHGSSVCGQVAEVVVSERAFRVTKVTCVLECGTVVNPQLVCGQVEGSILWALTPVLHGGLTIREGRVVESNFHDSPIVRMGDVPEMDVVLLESDAPPGKVGEAAVPPLAPAVANALFAATGKRVRGFPFARYL